MSRILPIIALTAFTLSLNSFITIKSYAGEKNKQEQNSTIADANTTEQPDEKEYVITLKNGTVIYCKILEKSYKGIKIFSENIGEIFIPLSEVEKIKEKQLSQIRDSTEKGSEQIRNLEQEKERMLRLEREISEKKKLEAEIKEAKQHVESLNKGNKIGWFRNPNDTRYLFAPTAKPIGAGKGYLQDIAVVVGAANYGISDNFSIGGIASLIPFVDVSQQLLAFTPKIGMNVNDNLSIGSGFMYVSGGGLAQMGVAYQLTTFGNSDTNFTLGLGAAYGNIVKNGPFKPISEQQISNGANAQIIMLGGMHRLFETISIISENWAIFNSVTPKPVYMFSFGFRFFDKSSSFDLGFIYPMIQDIRTFPLPYIDVVWGF